MSCYLIIANGDRISTGRLFSLASDRTIIALDGAADTLPESELFPNIILGDFDSIQTINRFSDASTILHTPDQDFTDLEKALQYCDAKQASDIAIVCATGGRLDHHQAAIHYLKKYYKKNRPLRLHTETQIVFYALNETIIHHANIGEKCGVFPEAGSLFSTKGLLYDVKDYTQPSISNSFREPQVTITVEGSALLIMPRDFDMVAGQPTQPDRISL